MPNQPSTPARSFRCSDEEWDELRRIADDLGLDMSSTVRLAIRRLIRHWPIEES